MRNRRHSTRRLCTWACILALVSTSVCHAQKKDEPTSSELLKKAGTLINAQKYDDAVVVIAQYLDLVRPSTAQGVIEIAQDMRFRMVTFLIDKTKEQRLEEATMYLQEYIDLPLCEHPRLARSTLATCYFKLNDFERCIQVCSDALRYNEDPSSRAGARAWTEEETIKFSKFTPIEYENEYTAAEITLLYKLMGDAYYNMKKWAECIEPYTYVANHITDSQMNGFVIMQMINALLEMADYDRIADWVPELYRTDARFNIRVNLALMNVAESLYKDQRYDDALPLYRMIIPREELLAYQREKLREMRIEASLPPEENMTISDDEKRLFGVTDSSSGPSEEEARKDIPEEISELETLIKQIEEMDPYEMNIKYNMAQIYESVERFWEAVRFYDVVHQFQPDSDIGNYCAYQAIQLLLGHDELAEAEEYGFRFLEQQKKGVYPRRVAFLFVKYHYDRKQMTDVKKLVPYLEEFVRAGDDPDLRGLGKERLYDQIMLFDSELYFLQAVADMLAFEFPNAEAGFKRVLDEFPGVARENDALYWYGMTKVYQATSEKFEEGLVVFDEYVLRFPKGSWVDEASYEGGVCMFGLGRIDEAFDRFTHVIETYPDPDPSEFPPDYSSAFPDACTMRGDIYGSLGKHDLAIADYEMAIKHASKHNQINASIFALAKVYEVLKEYDKIVTTVNLYLNDKRWEKNADIAKALYWIGKSKLQMAAVNKTVADDLVDEVITDYLNAIERFGGDVHQEGVDLMITELVHISRLWLNYDRKDQLHQRLDGIIKETEDPTLKLRFRVVLAMLLDTEAQLGQLLLIELENFENVPPPVLLVICRESIKQKDYSRAEELLDIFKKQFDESTSIREAYRLRALGQIAEKNFEGALETVQEVQGRFSGEPDMAWAQLMQGQILLELGDFIGAADANKAVLGVSAWRGQPLAVAYYQMGQVEERRAYASEGQERRTLLAGAFYLYQNVYIQYKAYDKGYWAAEAYLSCARCLAELGEETKQMEIYRVMLLDRFVNQLPQTEIAREKLGAVEVAKVMTWIDSGVVTNIVVSIEKPAVSTAEGEQTE